MGCSTTVIGVAACSGAARFCSAAGWYRCVTCVELRDSLPRLWDQGVIGLFHRCADYILAVKRYTGSSRLLCSPDPGGRLTIGGPAACLRCLAVPVISGALPTKPHGISVPALGSVERQTIFAERLISA